MSKETFLEELRGYLEILEDQEQQDILEEYDNCETACSVQITPRAEKETAPMGSLFASSLQQQILKMDVMAMTPIEALNALYKLQDEAKREGGEL